MNPAGTERAAPDPPTPSPPRMPGTAGTTRPAPPPGSHEAPRPWAIRLAKAAPAAIPAAVMALLGLWGLARDSSLASDEAATRIAAQTRLCQFVHQGNRIG